MNLKKLHTTGSQKRRNRDSFLNNNERPKSRNSARINSSYFGSPPENTERNIYSIKQQNYLISLKVRLRDGVV